MLIANWSGAFALACLTWILVGCGSEAATTDLARAVDACDIGPKQGFLLGADGKAITIEEQGLGEAEGARFDEVQCLLTRLNAPLGVIRMIDQTSPRDGRQTAEWDSFRVSWDYFADFGLDVIIRVVN